MKRLNLTLLLVTAATISITGCSGGKLRNLLSRNDYKTLEEFDDEKPGEAFGEPPTSQTQVVSATSEPDNKFFKMPAFLKGKDSSSSIAPDPFLADSVAASEQKSLKEYQDRVDARIARETQQSRKTLAEVEDQARQIFNETSEKAVDQFATSVDRNTTNAGPAFKDTQQTSNDEFERFAEMYEKQEAASKSAHPLIADSRASESSALQAETMKEFEQLLQAHERNEAHKSDQISIEPSDTNTDDIFAALDAEDSSQPTMEEIFGSEFAFNDDSSSSSSSSSAFSGLGQQNSSSTPLVSSTASASDSLDAKTNSPWNQLQTSPNTERDVFSELASNQSQPNESSRIFNGDFQQTVNNHGFSTLNPSWEKSIPQPADKTGLAQPPAITTSEPRGTLTHSSQYPQTTTGGNGFPSDSTTTASPFRQASQSRNQSDVQDDFQNRNHSLDPNFGNNNTDEAFGLTIPAFDSNPASTPNVRDEQGSHMQQISASRQIDSAPLGNSPSDRLMSVGSTSTALEFDSQLMEVTSANASGPELSQAGPAVHQPVSKFEWPMRNWFLLLGCVLIACLLFLPERKKR